MLYFPFASDAAFLRVTIYSFAFLEKHLAKSKIECPYAYKFGEGWGDHEECEEDECEKYDECFEKYDELQE